MNDIPNEQTQVLYQGEFLVSNDPSKCIVTVLGSCVSACLYDPVAHIGGANHFLVAKGPSVGGDNLRYGIHAMELLINALLREGAEKGRLVAKIFGGAKMFDDMVDIGQVNADFAIRFLEDENIPVKAQSLFGRQARRIRFWPASGRAMQRIVHSQEGELQVAETHKKTPSPVPDVVLF